jgi:putative inorganic carbon (hco3(-)) transporter
MTESAGGGMASIRLEPRPMPRLSPGVSRFRRLKLYAAVGAAASLAGLACTQVSPVLIIAAVMAAAGVFLILNRPFVGLLIYAVVYFLRPGEQWPALGALHVERMIGILTICGAMALVYFKRGALEVDQGSTTRWFLLFAAAAFLSIPTSYWPSRSIEKSVDVAKLAIFYVMIVMLVKDRRRLRIFVWTYVLLVAYIVFTSLKSYYSGTFLFAQGIERAIGVNSAAGGENELGTTMACTFPILVYLALRERNLLLRASAGIIGMSSLWLMTRTGSRASLLGFLAGCLYLWWNSKHRVLVGVVGAAALLAVFVTLPDQYQDRYRTLTVSQLDGSSRSRIQTWTVGLKMIAARPLFGVGIGCFGAARADAFSIGKRSFLESHSLYVQVPSEIGLVGAAAFFVLFSVLKRNRRALKLAAKEPDRRWEHGVLSGLCGGFLVLLVSGGFGHSMMRPTWYLYAGLVVVIYRLVANPESHERPRTGPAESTVSSGAAIAT